MANDRHSRSAAMEAGARKRLGVLVESQNEHFPYVTDVCGERFMILSGVFSPKYFESTSTFVGAIRFEPKSRFLEIGTGCGATSILLLKGGLEHAVATDISRRALQNARLNAELHRVEGRLDLRKGSLFRCLGKNELFDLIYWNAPWVYVPSEYMPLNLLERSVCDPGYSVIERFVSDVKRWLAPDGVAVLGFGPFGKKSVLDGMIAKAGLARSVSLCSRSGVKRKGPLVLYELRNR